MSRKRHLSGLIFAILFLSISCSKAKPTQSPTPPATSTVTDIDGNVYPTVKIGAQWWMAANLQVTRYRNGDTIPNVTDSATWGSLTSGARCDYGNSSGNVATYGRLYNWYAIADSRNVAPSGWHVATDSDYIVLTANLGGATVAGGAMKEAGTAHWVTPNTGATNSSGFSAVPGGYRFHTGYFYDLGGYATFWTATENNSSSAWYFYLSYNNAEFDSVNPLKGSGFSVRCVKDN